MSDSPIISSPSPAVDLQQHVRTCSPDSKIATQNNSTTSSSSASSKRANFSISNLLAPEEGKKTAKVKATSENVQLNAEHDNATKSANAYSPFINATTLAHLAHLHATPGWDWLANNGDPQSLWSR